MIKCFRAFLHWFKRVIKSVDGDQGWLIVGELMTGFSYGLLIAIFVVFWLHTFVE